MVLLFKKRAFITQNKYVAFDVKKLSVIGTPDDGDEALAVPYRPNKNARKIGFTERKTVA